MITIQTILDAAISDSTEVFSQMFIVQAKDGSNTEPLITEYLKDSNICMNLVETEIYKTIWNKYLQNQDMFNFVDRAFVITRKFNRIKQNLDLCDDDKLSNTLDAFRLLHQRLLKEVNTIGHHSEILFSFWCRAMDIIEDWQLGPELCSPEEYTDYINFGNTIASKLYGQELQAWLVLYSSLPFLNNIVPNLDIYLTIPNRDLVIYKTMSLSDIECCIRYKEHRSNKNTTAVSLADILL